MTITAYKTPNRQREDFDAIEDPAPSYLQTSKLANQNYVEVFRNKELQREGAAEDYTAAPFVAGPGGNSGMRVTFIDPLVEGDKVTMIYYPKE